MSKLLKLIPKNTLLYKLKPYLYGINSEKNYCKSCFSYYNVEQISLKNTDFIILTKYYNDKTDYPIDWFESRIKIKTSYLLDKCKIYSYNKPFIYNIEENLIINDDKYDNDIDKRETNYKYKLNIDEYSTLQYDLTSNNVKIDLDIKKYYNNFTKELINHIDHEIGSYHENLILEKKILKIK